MESQISTRQVWLRSVAVFIGALVFLFALDPSAPYTKQLGVCESGAVRDVLAGNIILPRFIPGPIVHVPPLYWWSAAVAVHEFGWNEMALRLPAMIPAALTAAILFGWMAVTIGSAAGLWAVAALLFCHFFTDAARQPRMDSMLVMFVTAACVCLERVTAYPRVRPPDPNSPLPAANPHPPANSNSRRTLYLALAALTMGLGILSKGVLGFLLPGAAIFAYLLVRKRFRDMFRLDLIAAFAVAFAIGFAWYVAAFQIGGDEFLYWQLKMNLWNRFLPSDLGGAGYCAHPVYYFVPHTLSGFIPWSLYVPALGVWLWPRRGRKLPEPIVYALCWFAGIFIFFSSSEGKCLVYILPVFPPLAALTGAVIAEVTGKRGEDRLLSGTFIAGSAAIAMGALAMALAAIAIVIFGVPHHIPYKLHPTDLEYLGIFAKMASRLAPTLLLWIAAFIIGSVITFIGLRGTRFKMQVVGVLIVALSGSLFWFGVMSPALARHETLRGFARRVARIVPADARIGHVGIEDCDIYFYSPRPIEPIPRLECGNDPNEPRYVVIRQDEFDRIPAPQRSCFRPIAHSAAVDAAGPRLLVERFTGGVNAASGPALNGALMR